ncbi:MAG: glycosyltransferase family 4 protein [Gaiellaceae bacterium]
MAAPSLPLVWHAPLEDPSGYADEARAYLVALERTGRPAAARHGSWCPVRMALPREHRETIDRAVARPLPDGEFVFVQHMIPGGIRELNTNGPTVARTMFETDRTPARWLPRLLEVDELWVPTEFNVETFMRSGVPRERIHVLPETIDFDLFDPAAVHVERDGEPFTFLTNFDFTERKGWRALLDAWATAFAPDEPVRLRLKCLGLHGLTEDGVRARIAAHLGGRTTAPFELDMRVLDVDEMPMLYAAADAFVMASRGEGWGRPYMEAMAMGLPTIGSRWSGNLAFMHDGNSVLVGGTLVPVEAWSELPSELYAGHSWFEPDIDELANALQRVAGGEVRFDARAELIERFGAEATSARLCELTEGALARRAQRASRPVACVWRGGWGSAHSLAVVNDALAGALEEAGDLVVKLAPESQPSESGTVGVASQWPPDFEAPSDGPFVLYQPWEFGEIPAAWAESIRARVDEVWTPSEYSRRSFLAAGVAPELVHVVPNGVDLERFTPAGEAWPLPQPAGTVFLFVGGTTFRKGIDLLLDAYGRAFTSADDVLLVVKGFGGGTFYRGQTAEAALEEFQSCPEAPRLLAIDEEVPFDRLPSLYRSADCLVQPYRGEGFCLPVLEALACGVPAIVTDGGPTDDFAGVDCAWHVDSHTIPLPDDSLPEELRPAGGGSLLEPDVDALVDALRLAADPAARAAKIVNARASAERFSWAAAAVGARERLDVLRGTIPIRSVRPALVPDAKRMLIAAHADWSDEATWGPALFAYAGAFAAGADTTLVLAASDGDAAVTQVSAFLDAAGIDADSLADVVLADPAELTPAALELAADAFVHVGGIVPARARRVVPADSAVLRSLLPIT